MPYVMVPVPEEHVGDVMQFVLKLLVHKDLMDWDEESAAEFFVGVDEPSRAVLSVVARASLTGQELPEPDLAEMIEFSRMDTARIVGSINERARELDPPRPHPLVITRGAPGAPGAGRSQRSIGMTEEVALLFQEAERRELAEDGSAATP